MFKYVIHIVSLIRMYIFYLTRLCSMSVIIYKLLCLSFSVFFPPIRGHKKVKHLPTVDSQYFLLAVMMPEIIINYYYVIAVD